MEAVLPYMLMVVGVALAGVLIAQNVLKRQPRHANTQNLTPHEKVERMRQVDGTRGDLRQMMIELEEVTRRFGSELDSRSARLEKLLAEANRTLAELERARKSPRVIPAKRFEEQIDPPDPLTSKVYELSDDGLPSIEIATQLHEHVGKVELILALRQQR